MEKREAVTYLKEILTKCDLIPDSFAIMNPNPRDSLMKGYKIIIKSVLNSKCREQVDILVKKYNLAIKEEKSEVLIYTPKATVKIA